MRPWGTMAVRWYAASLSGRGQEQGVQRSVAQWPCMYAERVCAACSRRQVYHCNPLECVCGVAVHKGSWLGQRGEVRGTGECP